MNSVSPVLPLQVPKVAHAWKWVYTRAWLFLLWVAAIVGLLSTEKEKSAGEDTPDALSAMGSPVPFDELFSGESNKWRSLNSLGNLYRQVARCDTGVGLSLLCSKI